MEDEESTSPASAVARRGSVRASRSRSRCWSRERLKRKRVRSCSKGKRTSEHSDNESIIISAPRPHYKNGWKSLVERNRTEKPEAQPERREVRRSRGRSRGTSVEQRNAIIRDHSTSSSEDMAHVRRYLRRSRPRSRSQERNPERRAREHRTSRLSSFINQDDAKTEGPRRKRRRYSRASSKSSYEDRSWDQYLQDIQIGLNTTVHKTTGKSPSELLFGIKIKSGSENILSEVINETTDKIDSESLIENRIEAGNRISEQQQKDKHAFDSKRKQCQPFSEGDLVCVKREMPSDGKSKKLVMKYQGPYRVKKVLPNDRYLVEDTPITQKSGRRKYENIVAIDKLKPWLSFDKNFDSSSESEADNSEKD